MKQSKLITGGLEALNRELKKKAWKGAKYTVLVDENTFQYCLPQLVTQVESLQEADFMEVPTGEDAKSIEVATQVWQGLLEGGATKSHVLICLGGGVVCDLGGFVAAGYMRGIRHILVPTTLLAMADAAIGGKTAVNLLGAKNSVGFFYPSVLTVIDPVFLASLSDEMRFCGWVEMVKTAAVADPALYQDLLTATPPSLEYVTQVAMIKERIVRADPTDLGARRVLNFGHTVGHAVESVCGMPHGVAVGIGMAVAMCLSVNKVSLPMRVMDDYIQWLSHAISRPAFSPAEIDEVLRLMRHDKKNTPDGLRMVLLQQVGHPLIDCEVAQEEVRDALMQWPYTER